MGLLVINQVLASTRRTTTHLDRIFTSSELGFLLLLLSIFRESTPDLCCWSSTFPTLTGGAQSSTKTTREEKVQNRKFEASYPEAEWDTHQGQKAGREAPLGYVSPMQTLTIYKNAELRSDAR